MLPSVGSIAEFYYPENNRVGVRPRCRKRRVLVYEVRDLVAEPLSAVEIASDPLLRRGRYMMTGVDLVSNETQTFALDWNMPVSFRLALVDKSDGETTLLDGEYKPTTTSAALLGAICRKALELQGKEGEDLREFQIVGVVQ